MSMICVIRGRVDQCVSAGAKREGQITYIVSVEYGNPSAALDKLCWRRLDTTMRDRDVPAGGKELPCHGSANLPGSAKDEDMTRPCMLLCQIHGLR